MKLTLPIKSAARVAALPVTVPSRSNAPRTLFLTGLCISALGSLAPGTLNLVVLQVTLQQGIWAAFGCSLGGVLLEMLFVRSTLAGAAWLQQHRQLFRVLEVVTALFVLLLAGTLLWEASNATSNPDQLMPLPEVGHPLLLGVVVRLLMPVCIPYWFGWNTILLSRGILQPGRGRYAAFTWGVGLGTLLAHSVYILGGQMAHHTLERYQWTLHWVIGAVLLVSALTLIAKAVRRWGR